MKIISYFKFQLWNSGFKKPHFWIAIAGVNLFAYVNCSQPYDINEHAYSGPISLAAVPVSVASSSQFTNKAEIPLSFSLVYSPRDMYITFVADCVSGGNWVPFAPKATVPWPNPDGVANVYVKFRNHSNVESTCYETSVIIDTQAPTIAIKVQPGVITNSNVAQFSFDAQDSLSGVDHLECSLDQASFVTCPADRSTDRLSDGAHTFVVRATDKAGNVSPPTSINWVIDSKAPILTITAQPLAISNNPNAHFQFSATDINGSGISQYLCQFGTDPEQVCQSPLDFNNLADGQYTLKVSAIDQAGNRATHAITWMIDTTPPVAQVTSGPLALMNSATAQFMFTASDNASGVASYTCLFDTVPSTAATAPVPVKCTSGVRYTNLKDNMRYSFTLTAYDRAGNASAPVNKIWDVDTSAPVIALDPRLVPDKFSKATVATFIFSATDSDGRGVDHVTCQLNQLPPTSCYSSATYVNLLEGKNNFTVTAYDAAGNNSSASYQWIFDQTPPVLSFQSKPTSSSKSPTGVFVFTATDGANGSGIDHYECSKDGAPATVCTSPQILRSLTLGVLHTFRVIAFDRAGNASVAPQVDWTP